jgi:type I restriction enzyme M protein
LLFDNELAKKTDEILFLKIENDGFDLGAQRRKIDKNDLPEALEVLEAWKQGKKLVPSAVEGKENNLSLWVKKEKIAESGDYNLTGERYRENALQFINLLRKQAEKDLQKYARILEPTMKQFNDFVSSPQFQTMQKTMQEAVSHFQKAGKNVDLQRIQSALEEVRRASNQKWPLVELGEVCSFEYGKPLKQEDRQGGEYPVFGSNGIVGHHNEYIVQGPFIVVGRKGTAGAVTYSEKSGYPIDTTFYVHLKDGQNIDLKFLYFTLRKLDLGKLNTQAGVPGLNRNDAYKTKIPLPPLEVQKEIVEQIEVKQNAINHAKEIIKNLERERRYFGQSLRKLKDVEWVEFSKYIKTITPPKKIQKSNFGNSGKYPIIDQSQEDISGWTDDGSAVVQIKKPVVIFGDHTCVVKYLDKPFVQGADGIKILQTNDKLLSKFLYYFLRTNLISSDGYKRHFSKLKEIKIPLPPLDVQKQLIVEAEKEEEIIASNRRLIDLMEKKINQVLAKI